MFIQATKLHKAFDENVILDNVSFSIGSADRIGLVGENGSGKSTLLQILTTDTDFDDGDLHIQKNIKIGYVPQVPNFDESETVTEVLSHYTTVPHHITDTLESLDAAGIADQAISQLSQGQKTKVYLARIALHEADLLLLDEPTNHLDLDGLRWLEHYLQTYKGAVVVVSHDRYFLDQVVTSIFDLERGELHRYGGNYSFFKEEKQLQKDGYAAHYSEQQQEIKRLGKAVARQKAEGNKHNYDRTNSRDNDKYSAHYHADRSSIKLHRVGKNMEARLEQMDTLEKPKRESVLDLYFKPSGAQNSNVVSISDLDIAYPGQPLLLQIKELSILYGNRIALQGANGSGKTTLIKNILDHTSHEQISLGTGVKIGYLSQDHHELQNNQTAVEALMSIEGVDQTGAYKILSQINISADQAAQQLQDFSSGQKTKLLLAKIMATGANFIILDEPTNHLDFQAIDVIENALREFKGTLLCISHDRYFLEQIGIERYMTIAENRLSFLKQELSQ